MLLASAIDVANSFLLLFILRTIWGLLGGAVLTVGATHIARLHQGAVATRQQGLYGGVLTLGGAIAFLLAPLLLARIGPIGLHTPGGFLGVPAIVSAGGIVTKRGLFRETRGTREEPRPVAVGRASGPP